MIFFYKTILSYLSRQKYQVFWNFLLTRMIF